MSQLVSGLGTCPLCGSALPVEVAIVEYEANVKYIVDEYDWLIPGDELRQYGKLELSGTAAPKRLGVDFAGQQSSDVTLKHYNNDSAEEGMEVFYRGILTPWK